MEVLIKLSKMGPFIKDVNTKFISFSAKQLKGTHVNEFVRLPKELILI